jgi:uncharacterized membrane protein YhaH (DUF805 family)
MSSIFVFLLGLAITIGLSLAIVWYLSSHMEWVLIDLCGTERRADFWMAFSNIILILVPLIFAMQVSSAAGDSGPLVLQLIYQLKWSLIGLVTSLLALGAILSLFIRRKENMRGEISDSPSASSVTAA